jgi:hypothetical protein
LDTDEDEYIAEMRVKGSLNYIAGGLALEFLQFSPKAKSIFAWRQVKMSIITYFIGLILGGLAVYLIDLKGV